MDNRRFTALMLTMIFMALWITVVQRMFPQWFAEPEPPAQANVQVDDPDAQAIADANDAVGTEPEVGEPGPDAAAEPPASHPRTEVRLGSLDPASGYYLEVVATSEGASLRTAQFNDPNLLTLDRQSQLAIIQPITDAKGEREFRTLTVSIPQIDAMLSEHDTNLSSIDWEVLPRNENDPAVSFQFEYGGFKVTKTFTLQPGDPSKRDSESQGYFVDVALSIENNSGATQEIEYTWLGPVGLPQENVFNARFLQEIKVGALEDHADPETITLVQRNADQVVDQVQAARDNNDPNEIDTWRDPLVWVGVDVQYFAGLMVAVDDVLLDADGDGAPDPVWQWARPRLLVEDNDRPMISEISVQVRSRKIALAADNEGKTHSHAFRLYLGPKRENLLDQFKAGEIITFGWFASVSRLMINVLNFFHHSMGLPYALAIILLTVCVKTIMFPFSIKTSEVQRKQKELTPELNQIKEKFKNEPEKFLKAQRELFHKHGHRPFVYGCLPSLLMLPIYIGLFYGLDKAFDLRLARFLWIDNLAAPDALFQWPFEIPWFGYDFNLLPVLTVALMIVQQKYFAPPPATEEQALQMKFMSYMMVAIGLMFWHVAAGLCLYFITQNLWGMGERKLLEYLRPTQKTTDDGSPIVTTATTKRASDDREASTDKGPTIWQRLQAAADQAQRKSSLDDEPKSRSETAANGSGSKKKSRRRR